ncbi:RNA polymerase sigma factor [Egicoccus sp. AB-alg2]|uniref:RNA polymerase sigma factor n=1 Tax=Egicoccus sp. AB-alg2 TaxID=3242693 RepID=UPI00359E5E8F
MPSVDVDPDLVRAVQRGDAGAMDALVRATYAEVYATCRRLLGDPADAADATQEVYLRVTRSVLGFRAESAFGTWLHRVALNVCATMLRRRGDGRARGQVAGSSAFAPDEHVHDQVDTADAVADRDHARRVAAAIERLPPAARDVVVLRDVHGLSTKEAAGLLGLSESAVKVRLHRAHARLRALLHEVDRV